MTGLGDMMDVSGQRNEQILLSQKLNKIVGIKRELQKEEKDDILL